MVWDDPFESPRLTLARAEENVSELHNRIGAFFDRKPYARFADKDPQTGWERHKLRLTAKIPGSVSAVFSDAINNLSNALDQAVCASSIAMGVTDLRNMYFPMADSEEELANALKARCKNVPPPMVEFLRTLKPYNRPANLMWSLRKLAAGNKHQMLTPMLVSSTGAFGIRDMGGVGVDWMPVGIWDGAKNELTVALVRPGAKPRYNLDFRLEVAFGENQAKIDGPALPLLGVMFSHAAQAVDAIEAETKRLLHHQGV